MSARNNLHGTGLVLVGAVGALLCLTGVVATWFSGAAEPAALIAGGILSFNKHFQQPSVLFGLLLAVYVSTRLPSALDAVADILSRRLTTLKVGDLQLVLAPDGAVGGADLAPSGDTVWISPSGMWVVMAPAHQGELRGGAPHPVPPDYAAFPAKLADICARLKGQELSSNRTEASKRRDELHELLWEDLDRAEMGWSDEWVDHLERSAAGLEGAGVRGGLGGGLGRSLLFRRMMLLDAALRLVPNEKAARRSALGKLVGCLPALSNEVRAGFYRRPIATTLLMLLLQDGEKDLVRTLGEDAGRMWVDGEMRRYEGGHGGFADACQDAVLYLEKNWQSLTLRAPAADKVHPSTWAVRLLMRMEARERLGDSPEVASLALSLLQGLPATGETPTPQLRQLAARRLCRSWPYGPAEAATLVMTVPEVSASPACLNDLARALCKAAVPEEVVRQARRYLQGAKVMAPPKSDLERVLDANLKALEGTLSPKSA